MQRRALEENCRHLIIYFVVLETSLEIFGALRPSTSVAKFNVLIIFLHRQTDGAEASSSVIRKVTVDARLTRWTRPHFWRDGCILHVHFRTFVLPSTIGLIYSFNSRAHF